MGFLRARPPGVRYCEQHQDILVEVRSHFMVDEAWQGSLVGTANR